MPRRRVLRYMIGSRSSRVPPHYYDVTRAQVFAACTTQQNFIDRRDLLHTIMRDHRLVASNVLNQLDCDTGDSTFDYADRDHVLTTIAHDNLALTGRTFGVADPESITEADPLGLMLDTAGNPRTDTIIIDPQGANETANAQDGPVITGRSDSNCTTPLGLDKSPAPLWVTNGVQWRYRFWTRLKDMHENGGAGTRTRFIQFAAANPASLTLTVYVRFSDAHVIDEQIHLGKQPDADGGIHAARIIVRGYPTDAIPVIPMGTAVTQGTPDTIPSSSDVPSILIGGGVTQGRRIQWRWLHFVGNREGEFNGDTGQIFAAPMFMLEGSDNDGSSFRYCGFTGFQPIHPGNADAASFPEYVDIVHGSRSDIGTDYHDFVAIRNRANYLDVQYCYFQGADTDIPFSEYTSPTSPEYVRSRAFDNYGSNVTLRKCTFEGFGSGDYVRFSPRDSLGFSTDFVCEDNVITSNGYKCFLAVRGDGQTLTGVVRRNFIYNWGSERPANDGVGIQTDGGVAAHLFGQGIVFEDNTVVGNIDGQAFRDALTGTGCTIETVDSGGDGSLDDNIVFRRNILYRCGIGFNSSVDLYANADTQLATVTVTSNIIEEAPPAPLKQDNGGSKIRDACLNVNLFDDNTLGNTSIVGNNIRRASGDTLNATTLLAFRTGGAASDYYTATSTTLAGFSGTTQLDPGFADPANGNFNLSNATLAAMVSAAPKTRAATGAWRLPGW